jgi:hypothetical protein
MKKRTLARIKVEREKRAQKRARRHPSRRAKDPKDLRGSKGVLLKTAVDAALALEEGIPGPGTAGQRYAPLRVRSDR